MRIAGIDASLTSTGFARNYGVGAQRSGVIKPDGLFGVERLQFILDQVASVTRLSEIVLLEGYAYGARNQAHQLGELGGVLRLAFHQIGVRLVVVPPTKLKKFATGSGKGGKDHIFAEAIRRLGYEGSSHDEADALWLLEMGLHFFDIEEKTKLPASRLSALQEWAQWEGARAEL